MLTSSVGLPTLADSLSADAGDVTTAVKVQPSRLRTDEENEVTLRVVARGSATASGTVVLDVADGVAVLTLPELPAGRHQAAASYVGDAATEASSTTATLTVAQPRGGGRG